MDSNETTAATAARKFLSVNGKDLGSSETAGDLTFVRASKLAADGITGVVAEGIYEGGVPSRFDEEKMDYKIRKDNGDLIIVNNAGSLASQMAKVETGSYVQITYLGQDAITEGKFKGKLAHRFVVGVAAE